MRKIISTLVVILLVVIANSSLAQWNLTGNNNATKTSIVGTTNAINLNLGTRNLTRMVIDSNGKVGVGIAAPPNVFSVKGSGGVPNSVWVNSGNPLFTGFGEQTIGNADYVLSMASTAFNARPVFIGRRSKGTLAAPLSVANNDFLMSFLASGYDGTAFQNAAAIDFFVDGIPAAGSVPARISFVTGSNSSNRAERLKIGNTGDITMNGSQLFVQKSTGNVGIGTTAPNALLQMGNTVSNRKIVLFDIANNNHQFYGFGINNATLRYQVDATTASHVFYAGTGSTSSNELMRIQGNGNVGIGTTTPTARLDITGNIKITDGTQGAGKVLTSNANGMASWSTPTSSPWAVSGNNISTINSGNVGIGTTTPRAKLDVNGDALINGLKAGKGGGNQTTNTAFGINALDSNKTAGDNTAIGYQALRYNTAGSSNTAIGVNALYANTTGYSNVAIGNNALRKNTTGTNLVAIGDSALFNQIAGWPDFGGNTAVGSKALYSNTYGYNNTANGSEALKYNTTGAGNTANGWNALYSNTTGIANTANGAGALYYDTTGSYNTANGTYVLYANTSGYYNTGSGSSALSYNTTGYYNTANGFGALYYNTTGSSNTANGNNALFSNDTGNYNTANGSVALYSNITGSDNTANGFQALYYNTSGSYNTANGEDALYNNTTGSLNTGNGKKALYANTTGQNNTAIGYTANTVVTTQSNTTGLGYDADPTADNTIAVGNTSVTSIKGQVGFTTYSDQRFKKNIKEGEVVGLAFINKLRPLTYNTSVDAFAKWKEANYGEKDTTNWEGKYDIEKIRFSGFLAQEVEATAKSVGYNFSGVDKPKNDKDFYGLRYAEFVVPLVKAVQELSKKNEELKKESTKTKADLQKQIDELKAIMQQLLNTKSNAPCPPLAGR